MIEYEPPGHEPVKMGSGPVAAAPSVDGGAPDATPSRGRLRAIFDAHYGIVWRSLRRFGVPNADTDDAAQEVFMVAARRLDDIEPGSERAFLIGTACRIASNARRARARRPQADDGATEPDHIEDAQPSLEDLTDRARARKMLDRLLDEMPAEMRAVFVLYELEGLPGRAIATSLEIPEGTVASRLRRARAHYQDAVKRLRARMAREA